MAEVPGTPAEWRAWVRDARPEDARRLAGISRRELGERIGVPQRTIANWERGSLPQEQARRRRWHEAVTAMTDAAAPARPRDVFESAAWRHLPAGTAYAASQVDVILAAADAFAAHGSARARDALGEMWGHLFPGSPPADAAAVLLAADMYAAVTLAEALGALESPSAQAERRRVLAGNVPRGYADDVKRRRPPCGSRNAAEWHRRHGERPDEACRKAESRYHLEGIRRRAAAQDGQEWQEAA